jgi:hypothetical protein
MQSRVTVVTRNAAGERTASFDVASQRIQASCTTSSASEALPSIR